MKIKKNLNEAELTFIFSDMHLNPIVTDGDGNRISCMTSHDDKALSIAFQKLVDLKKSGAPLRRIVMLGDLYDAETISHFAKDAKREGLVMAADGEYYAVKSWKEYLLMGENFFRAIRDLFPNVDIVFFEGNHDAWINALMMRPAMKMFTGDLHIKNRPFWKELNIEYVDYDYSEENPQSYRIYGPDATHCFVLMHGYDNVSPKKMQWDYDNVIYGHQHKELHHLYSFNSHNTRLAISIGCLCKKNPSYKSKGGQQSGWDHAFAIVSQLPDGTYTPYVFRIERGYVLLEPTGKIYRPVPLSQIHPLLGVLELP